MASVFVCVAVTFAPSAHARTWWESDGYYAHEPTPLSLYGVSVGTSKTLRVTLPSDYDPARTPMAVFWLAVDDIDHPKEVRVTLNGQAIELPKSVIGEGAEGHRGHVTVDPKLLRAGDNIVSFAFKDNLEGSTSGFDVHECALMQARLDGKTNRLPMIGREVYVEVAGFGEMAVYDSSLKPRTIRMRQGEDPVGWKKHMIRQYDGRGGWLCREGEFRFLHAPYGEWLAPFSMTRLDNGELILLATWKDGVKPHRILISFSKDNGDTWSDWHNIPGGFGRPMMLASLGKGKVTFASGRRFWSNDYGRTWPERMRNPPAPNGGHFFQEGHSMVDYDAHGNAFRIAETGSNTGPKGSRWDPAKPTCSFIRWSTDGGRTWLNETSPAPWRWKETWQGKTYERRVNEGSLLRARNGWIIAALRANMPPQFCHLHYDQFDGVGVSISKDDGKTWSPIKLVQRCGRMHPNLVLMPNGDIVMGFIMRQDIAADLTFGSYNRGYEAIISRDHGETWDVAHKYVLDAWPYVDPARGPRTNACGHTCAVALPDGRILTCYGHYVSKGVAMIRWRP